MKLDHRYKSNFKCSNCNNYLKESSIAYLFVLGSGLTGAGIVFLQINLIIKIILFVLLTILFFYIEIYIIPIVKEEWLIIYNVYHKNISTLNSIKNI